jgi:septal ring factor EnvC (AmiA/AmiB activator)
MYGMISIYLLTAVGLSPGGSTHLHTNNTQNNTNNNRTKQINNVEECGPCPVFASFYPGICLTTEEKAQKNLSKFKKNLSQVNKNLSQVKKNLRQVKKNFSQVKKKLQSG